MLIDKLLVGIAWGQGDQCLSVQRRPRRRCELKRTVLVGANQYQRKPYVRIKRADTRDREPIRDRAKDHLLTPKNSALLIIDCQPVQVNSITSMDRQKLIDNIVGVAKAGRAFGLPIIHSTVNVKTGLNKPYRTFR
jgi:hypothetical protein